MIEKFIQIYFKPGKYFQAELMYPLNRDTQSYSLSFLLTAVVPMNVCIS